MGSCTLPISSGDVFGRNPFAGIAIDAEADADGKLSGTWDHEGDIRPLAGRVEGQSLSFTLPGWFAGGQLKGSIEDNGARLLLVAPPPPEGVRVVGQAEARRGTDRLRQPAFRSLNEIHPIGCQHPPVPTVALRSDVLSPLDE